jgi:hypothetical protein
MTFLARIFGYSQDHFVVDDCWTQSRVVEILLPPLLAHYKSEFQALMRTDRATKLGGGGCASAQAIPRSGW